MYNYFMNGVFLWAGRGFDNGRHGGTDGDDASGQEDDDEHDDEDDDHDDHDDLDIFPPVGASHFLRRVLEVLCLDEKERTPVSSPKRPHAVTLSPN